MNFMRKTCSKISRQFVRAFVSRSFSSKGTLIAEHLSERSLIRVEGNEVVPFLQGLVTNDMTHFDRGARAMYAMFLNNTGRVLYDSIIYRTGDENVYLVECDKSTCSELRRHLRMFRVRRNIEVDSIGTDYLPWVVFKYNKPERDAGLEEVQLEEIEGSRANEVNSDEITLTTGCIDFNAEEVVACQDPRIKALGLRVIMPKPFSYPELSKLFSQHDVVGPSSQVDYKYLRYTLGIGEGVIDHPPNKCFPLEANCDFLHGVSFHKGCYIGQELTARVHHTGVIRKRLMPIKLTKKVDEGVTNVQSVGGSVVGTIRGVRNDAALALLRVEHVFKIPNLAIDGDPCKLMIPDWWPKELPNKHVLQERINERT